jgi:PPOX class probable F420-dependent enzyme
VKTQLKRLILRLLKTHRVLTLATLRADGWPQATTVTYANDALTIYVIVSVHSQKARNIRHDARVSLTVDHDYDDWNEIRGLSMAATAALIEDEDERMRAAGLLAKKFPEIAAMGVEEMLAETAVLKIRPKLISVLDYSKGFGHTDLVSV